MSLQAVVSSILSGMVITLIGQCTAVVQHDEEWNDGQQITEINVGNVAVVAGIAGEGIKNHV